MQASPHNLNRAYSIRSKASKQGVGVVCAPGSGPDSVILVVILNHQTRIICLLTWIQGLVEIS